MSVPVCLEQQETSSRKAMQFINYTWISAWKVNHNSQCNTNFIFYFYHWLKWVQKDSVHVYVYAQEFAGLKIGECSAYKDNCNANFYRIDTLICKSAPFPSKIEYKLLHNDAEALYPDAYN